MSNCVIFITCYRVLFENAVVCAVEIRCGICRQLWNWQINLTVSYRCCQLAMILLLVCGFIATNAEECHVE